ncbi:uncharacterized protein BJ171DRAFT_506204 [Polychytrium aggregatum]|uniref:uncharacterized protein n=1 Tax=Polychytrium aggregatum TaxID=110093 RepID=UPI0022FE2F33|nr:uncharacterized protein BJ171DRAFT_506204 [Polychytrium aggregatum]KAI9204134.1 hypothetical protein BJ171DRAFT_506204 [Polychytrium aggregatum]
MLKKENELWSEVYRDRQLFDRVQRFCQVTDPKFRFPEEARPNGSEQPSVEEMVAIAERQSFGICWSIRVNSRNRLTIRPNDITDRTAYVSKLLPFDIAGIDRAREKRLTIEGVSFLEVSGWPKTLSNIQGLTIKHKLFGRVADPLISLEGMPSELPKLIALDLSGCSQLTSLKGMPEMPMLLELNIPVGMETIVGIPEELPSLTKLVISSHMPHNILSQLPSMPRLNHLILPNRFVSLADLHVNQSSLKVLNLHACYELKSLDGIPPYPRLEILHASSQIKRVRGLVHKLPSLKTLHLDSSIRMFDRSWLTDCFGRYADYFNLGWRITSWRISGLPKGCRVVFNNTFEYTFGRFSSWLGMELLNILCFLYLALSLVPLSIAGLFFVLLTMVWTIVLAITFGLTKLF